MWLWAFAIYALHLARNRIHARRKTARVWFISISRSSSERRLAANKPVLRKWFTNRRRMDRFILYFARCCTQWYRYRRLKPEKLSWSNGHLFVEIILNTISVSCINIVMSQVCLLFGCSNLCFRVVGLTPPKLNQQMRRSICAAIKCTYCFVWWQQHISRDTIAYVYIYISTIIVNREPAKRNCVTNCQFKRSPNERAYQIHIYTISRISLPATADLFRDGQIGQKMHTNTSHNIQRVRLMSDN